MNDKIIVALDTSSLKDAQTLVETLYPTVKFFKIGKELFTAAGPAAVEMVTKKGADVFLDLKFHDIPNTVARAIKSAIRLKPFMLNVHASGGDEMLKAAAGSIKSLPKAKRPILLAVTVLTSMDRSSLNSLGISRPPLKQVIHLAKMAKKAGVDGVVCSPKEIMHVRGACGPKFKIVTPGVRPQGANAFDQKRIATPKWAIKQGADFLVVGRPITKADDPKLAAQKIIESMCS